MTQTPIQIAIVDDERDMRESIAQWLGLSGYQTQTYASAPEALKDINADFTGIVISDIKMPQMDGISFLRRLQKIDRQLPVILITGHGDVAMAVQAMQIGAYDFLEKPFDPKRMADLTKRAVLTRRLTLENRILRRELSDGTVLLRKMIGSSTAMQQLREDILDLAQADGHALITGEIGTGKRLIAHALHACGSRQGRKFIVLNCAAYTEDELQKRLFGQEDIDKPSLLESAVDGTLCLEDVDAIDSAIQTRLLAKLTEYTQQDRNQLRIIAIQNDTGEMDKSADEQAKHDLYYRFASMHITPPPLRHRGEDILDLFNHYLERFADDYGCKRPEINAEDAAKLLQAPWPGNIRQLINLAERTVLQSRRGAYSIKKILSDGSADSDTISQGGTEQDIKPLKEHVEAFERMLIDNMMRQHKGSIQAVMRDLSLPRRTLNEKMAKYGLSRSNYVR